MREEGVVTLHLPTNWVFKNPLWVGLARRCEYHPISHLATAPSVPVTKITDPLKTRLLLTRLTRLMLYLNVYMPTTRPKKRHFGLGFRGSIDGYIGVRCKGRKEMFYLTTQSTHFILRLYSVGHMVKDLSDSERETRYRHMGYSFRLTARFFFYMHYPTDSRITHSTAFITPVVEHWLEREIAQWIHPMDPTTNRTMSERSHHERTLLPLSYISLPQM